MREWIVTNGLGSYASLTYKNTNTRKFHGLLVASLNPPTQRWVFVSNIFDKIQIKDKTYNLIDYKNSFDFKFFPSLSYKINNVDISKTIFMEYGRNTTLIKYNISTGKPVTLIHSPFVNSRHFYDVNKQRYLSFNQTILDNGVSIKPVNIDKTLKIILKESIFEPKNYWEELYYEQDRDRNESWIDNNIHIGYLKKTIKKSSDYYLILTIEKDVNIEPLDVFYSEVQRRKNLLEKANLPNRFEKLVLSCDNFVVQKGNGKSVIAGYHWFGDWGRDTLIALPGLTLVTKRFEDAKYILRNLGSYCKNGLIPNAFMDKDSKAIYNTVDASLWFIDRVFQYLKYTNDKEFLHEVWETLQSIIHFYINGTDFNIYMDNDYLISHGPGLTWMDVNIDGHYITPRNKKAVEIQALWYNVLRIMSILAKLRNENDEYFNLSEKVQDSFNSQYDKQYDVIDTRDLSFRPNQIFLVSLDFTMINDKLMKKIVNDTQEKLVTIFGLRTLSQEDSNYKGNYIGDYNKDIAYHNGIVWPWLLGSFIKAFVKVKNFTPESRKIAFRNFLNPMFNVFGSQWDGSIYEIFNGAPIYTPQGCISQAWSVAEILRCWVEDIENIKPNFEKIYKSYKISV